MHFQLGGGAVSRRVPSAGGLCSPSGTHNSNHDGSRLGLSSATARPPTAPRVAGVLSAPARKEPSNDPPLASIVAAVLRRVAREAPGHPLLYIHRAWDEIASAAVAGVAAADAPLAHGAAAPPVGDDAAAAAVSLLLPQAPHVAEVTALRRECTRLSEEALAKDTRIQQLLARVHRSEQSARSLRVTLGGDDGWGAATGGGGDGTATGRDAAGASGGRPRSGGGASASGASGEGETPRGVTGGSGGGPREAAAASELRALNLRLSERVDQLEAAVSMDFVYSHAGLRRSLHERALEREALLARAAMLATCFTDVASEKAELAAKCARMEQALARAQMSAEATEKDLALARIEIERARRRQATDTGSEAPLGESMRTMATPTTKPIG